MTHRELVVSLAKQLWGTPYIWGGDDPEGFDCSGLVVEMLKTVGLMGERDDATAHALYQRFNHIRQDETRPGDLVFWTRGPGEIKIIHVGIIIDTDGLYIGANGGGSWATDPAEAMRRNAFIKIRPVESRGTRDSRYFASPQYEGD